MKNSDRPAYPLPKERDIDQLDKNGLTKREVFAMVIMQGIVSGYDPESKANGRYIPDCDYTELSRSAIQIADELLKQLES